MGSTGHSLIATSRKGNVNTSNFGVIGAVPYTGRIPAGKGLENVGANKITLKVASTGKQDIIFQFKLTKDNRLSIKGFDPNHPESKAHLLVSSSNPSIDRAAAFGTSSDKLNAMKLKQMFTKSTKIDEGQLSQISQKLLSAKRNKENIR